MEKYKWLIEILFGGLGTAIIGYIFFKKITNKTLIQKQKSGKNSINIQAGNNLKIKNSGKSNEQK